MAGRLDLLLNSVGIFRTAPGLELSAEDFAETMAINVTGAFLLSRQVARAMAGELVGTWEWVGGGGGISLPTYPGGPDERALLFYALCMAAAVATFGFLKWLYSTRFGLAINAIRDDEEKAEAMGVHTLRYKTVAWSIAAFFLGISGGIFGNMIGFIEPLEVAFPTVTFGIFMVAMALLGGKGTLWGPVIGALV